MAGCGHEAVVRLLLEHKADVDAKENAGSTALREATDSGHEAVVRVVLGNGDVAAKDDKGGTALHLAATKGSEAVVRLLV
jgi:ankyrin repeat protein